MEQVVVRVGISSDIPQVFELIKELAKYEKALHEVETSIDKLTEDAFGTRPLFGFFVAVKGSQIVGISIYYYRYSTWKGKRLYLEDILVTEVERRNGIGSKLFEATAKFALEDGCSGMNWLVLDWNEPAINFYKKYNAYFEPEWVFAGISRVELEKFRK